MLRFLVLMRAMRHNIALLLYAMLQRDTPRVVKFLFPLSLLYLISPVDIIPDTIPLVGAVDDMVILPAATSLLIRMLPAHTRTEGERRVERYGTWLLIGASILMVLWIVIFIWALIKVFCRVSSCAAPQGFGMDRDGWRCGDVAFWACAASGGAG